MDQTGDREIRQKIFKHVKELSPNTLFFLNDYGIVMNYGGRFQIFQEQIRELLAGGAPIDAIGLQSHIKVKFIYSEKATKFCEIFTILLSYVMPIKSKVKILQDFVAFSEYMNFKGPINVNQSVIAK